MRKGKPRFPQSRPASNRRPDQLSPDHPPRASGEARPAGRYGRPEPGGEGREPQSGSPRKHRDRREHGPGERSQGSGFWLFGLHAVRAGLANPRRHVHRILAARDLMAELLDGVERPPDARPLPPVEALDREAIGRLLPAGTVHQGVAARVEPLPYLALEDLLDALDPAAPAMLVVLDQVSDPHNVGAILRSTAAFGAAGLIVTERHAAPETGTLAKAASGALDLVPLVRVANLARALDLLKKSGFWCAGFAADAPDSLPDARLPERVALVLGSEGQGMRRLTREGCDLLLRLPTRGVFDQLNVSNAAAIALYEWTRQHRRPAG